MRYEIPVLVRMNGEFIYPNKLVLTEDERTNLISFFNLSSSTQLSLTLDSLLNNYNTIERIDNELSSYAKGHIYGEISSYENVQEYLTDCINELIQDVDSNLIEDEQEILIRKVQLETFEQVYAYTEVEKNKVKEKLTNEMENEYNDRKNKSNI